METTARAQDQSRWVRGEPTVSMARGPSELTPPEWVMQSPAEQGGAETGQQAGEVLPPSRRLREAEAHTYVHKYTHISSS